MKREIEKDRESKYKITKGKEDLRNHECMNKMVGNNEHVYFGWIKYLKSFYDKPEFVRLHIFNRHLFESV